MYSMERTSFETGKVVMTHGIFEQYTKDEEFRRFVKNSFSKYLVCDWGDTCKEDSEQNDISVIQDERILAVYKYPSDETKTIWIVTEWDRSITTILFPSEY